MCSTNYHVEKRRKVREKIVFFTLSFVVSLILSIYRDEISGNELLVSIPMMMVGVFMFSALFGGLLGLLLGEEAEEEKKFIRYSTAALVLCATFYIFGISQHKSDIKFIEDCLSNPDSYYISYEREEPYERYLKCREKQASSDYYNDEY